MLTQSGLLKLAMEPVKQASEEASRAKPVARMRGDYPIWATAAE